MGMVSRLRAKKARAEAKQEADQIMLKAFDDVSLDMETAWVYGIRKALAECGIRIGAQRMKRIYWTVIDEYKRMKNKFQFGKDDSHFFAMRQELKAVGIDVAELQAEAERRYPDGIQREEKRWGEE